MEERWREPAALAEQYAGMLYRLAYARTGSRADAEDVMQEVFVRLLRARPEFRDEEHAKAWLLRVGARCAADVLRAPWRRREGPLDDGLPAPEPPGEGGVVEAVLALPESLSGSFWSLALWGGLAATAVEYAVHVLYDRLLGVRFWDYSQVRWNLRGRVCLPFSLAWSLLVAAGLPVIQAAIAPALAAVPPTATYAALLVFTADTVVSLQLLRRAGDPAVLSLGNLRAA